MTTRFDSECWVCDVQSTIMAFGGGSSQPAGNTTSTQTSEPWSEQKPFLADIFRQAQDLYQNQTPQYFPGATYAGPTDAQAQALALIPSVAAHNTGLTGAANDVNKSLIEGRYGVQNNYATPFFQQFAGSNLGTNNAGTATLTREANGPNAGLYNPGAMGLGAFASGMYADAGNPYITGLTQSVLSQVTPSIQKQFIDGGGLSSPQAAYATSQGATAALAPLMFQQYQNDRAAQLSASGTLASDYLQGAGQQQSAAATLGNQALTGLGLKEQAATGLSNAYNSGIDQMIKGLALAPTTQALPYADLQAIYGAGTIQQAQDQAAINDAIQRYNFSQTLPYTTLNQYIGEVSGNYGGTTQLTQPYFQNSTANALSTGIGALTGLNAIGGTSGLVPGMFASAAAKV